MKNKCRALIITLVMALSGCITVPQEVVSLSSLTNNDIRKLHDGYRSLVRKHFAALRQIREQEFAQHVLGPYIEEAIKEGQLVDVVQGKVVWDNGTEAFVAPDPAKSTFQKLDTLNTWNRQVAIDIERLRADAFSDLQKKENEVLDEVDRAFGNVIRGGAAVYGYLLSIQKVENAQNDLLKEAGLEGLPEKINDTLDQASSDALSWSEKVKGVDDKANTLKNKVKKVKGR